MKLSAVSIALGIVATVPMAQAQQSPRTEILTSVRHGVTSSLRDSAGTHGAPATPFAIIPLRKPGSHPGGGGGGGRSSWTDADLTAATGVAQGVQGSLIQGITSQGSVPPDPNLSVSPSQIVQMVNTELAVWSKPSTFGGGATQLLAPEPIHSVFSSLGNSLCATSDGGDPVVLWDKFAQRWIVSQLAYNSNLEARPRLLQAARSRWSLARSPVRT